MGFSGISSYPFFEPISIYDHLSSIYSISMMNRDKKHVYARQFYVKAVFTSFLPQCGFDLITVWLYV
jgi:hypothetical protein